MITVTIVDTVVVAVAISVAVPFTVFFIVSVFVSVFVSVAVVGIVGRTGGVMSLSVPWDGATKNHFFLVSVFCLS